MLIIKKTIIKFRMTNAIFDQRREKKEKKKKSYGIICSTTNTTSYPNRKKTR